MKGRAAALPCASRPDLDVPEREAAPPEPQGLHRGFLRREAAGHVLGEGAGMAPRAPDLALAEDAARGSARPCRSSTPATRSTSVRSRPRRRPTAPGIRRGPSDRRTARSARRATRAPPPAGRRSGRVELAGGLAPALQDRSRRASRRATGSRGGSERASPCRSRRGSTPHGAHGRDARLAGQEADLAEGGARRRGRRACWLSPTAPRTETAARPDAIRNIDERRARPRARSSRPAE